MHLCNLDIFRHPIVFLKIPTSYCLRITLCSTLKPKKLKYPAYWNVYDCYNREKIEISIEDAVEETENVLEKAFNYRMVADVPVGVFLSGGYDSSCLVALLQKNKSRRIKTFTIGFEDEKLNEAQYAKEIASVIGNRSS